MTNTLPDGHPYARLGAGDGLASPEDVDPWLLATQVLAFRREQFGGWKMKDDSGDDDEGDDGEDDGDEDEEELLASEVTVEGKKVTIGDLISNTQRIMAREKRQGKKSGQAALLRDLGFDSVDAAKSALAKANPAPGPGGDGAGGAGDDDGDSEAARRAAEREAAAAKRETAANAKVRRADLRGALREHGVARDDLDDAFALLDRDVDTEYDEDELADAVEALAERRPALFASGEEDDSDRSRAGGDKTPPPRAPLPTGKTGRTPSRKNREFGAGGMDRARRKGWVKTDA